MTLTPTDETMDQVTLNAYKAARMTLVSIELVEDDAVDLIAFLGNSIGRAIGILEQYTNAP